MLRGNWIISFSNARKGFDL